MGGYTIELRHYIESFSQYQDMLSTRDKIEIGRPQLFDFKYPFFDETKRADFETNIIREFYFREIGFETMGRFKFELENWLLINMPYYNKMFESELLSYDPLENINTQRDNGFENEKDRKDNTDTTENVVNKNQNVGNEKTKDDGNFTQDGTSKTNVEQDTNSISENHVDGKTTKNENTNKDSDRTGSENTNGSSDLFQRDLSNDTPDNRLGITTEDGKGVIEYASKIDEVLKKEANKSDTTSKDKVNETGKLDGTGTNKVDENGKAEDHTKGKSDTTTHNEGTTSATGTKDTTSITDFTGDKTGNNKLDSLIKEKQKFGEKFVGKNGSMTYAEMIQKDRESYLRIEAMIHDELNKNLFMLIY